MRVISGRLKGKRLVGPKGRSIRPVLDKVKEAVFNILFDVRDCVVLDLFAGTGSIGIEALSRGARFVTFVESSAHGCNLIDRNLAMCNLSSSAEVIHKTVGAAIPLLAKRGCRYDIVFIDPPYDRGYVNVSVERVVSSGLITGGSVIVVEHSPREQIALVGEAEVYDQRQYGQTLVSFLRLSDKGGV